MVERNPAQTKKEQLQQSEIRKKHGKMMAELDEMIGKNFKTTPKVVPLDEPMGSDEVYSQTILSVLTEDRVRKLRQLMNDNYDWGAPKFLWKGRTAEGVLTDIGLDRNRSKYSDLCGYCMMQQLREKGESSCFRSSKGGEALLLWPPVASSKPAWVQEIQDMLDHSYND